MPARQTRLLRVDPMDPNPEVIQDAARVLRAGGLVAFPTETVYGLGANALDASAVRGIFEAKGRPSTDPLIVHVPGLEDVRPLVRAWPDVLPRLAQAFWPGPLTLILPKQASVPPEVTAGLDTVAVRAPSHPVARALIAAAGCPVAAPSANRFSRPSPTAASHVLADLDGRVDVVIDGGRTEIGVESTVLDLTVSPAVVRRPGGVALEALRALLPDVRLASHVVAEADAQVSPGQLLRHYAPNARMTLFEGPADAVRARVIDEVRARLGHIGRVGVLAPEEDIDLLAREFAAPLAAGAMVVRAYGRRRDPGMGARELFDAIRAFDAEQPEEILAIALAPEGIGLAVRDRLMRAAEGRVITLG